MQEKRNSQRCQDRMFNVLSVYLDHGKYYGGRRNHEDKLGPSVQSLVDIVSSLDFIRCVMGST